MGTTADKLNKILESKAAIKQALMNKGYSAEEVGDIFSQYDYLIENIPSRSGELETALANAKYDYAKDYLLDIIAESYEITKDWTDYSQLEGSKTYLIPYIKGAIIDAKERIRNSNILFFPSFIRFSDAFPSSMCENCKTMIISDFGLGVSNKVNGYRMFKNCYSLVICKGLINLISGSANEMFYECNSLKKIDYEFDFTKVSDIDTMFTGCTSLEYLRLKANTLNKSFKVSDCTKLSHDSLLSILNACIETESTLTLTLGATNLAKLSDEEKEIATNKGWTLA